MSKSRVGIPDKEELAEFRHFCQELMGALSNEACVCQAYIERFGDGPHAGIEMWVKDALIQVSSEARRFGVPGVRHAALLGLACIGGGEFVSNYTGEVVRLQDNGSSSSSVSDVHGALVLALKALNKILDRHEVIPASFGARRLGAEPQAVGVSELYRDATGLLEILDKHQRLAERGRSVSNCGNSSWEFNSAEDAKAFREVSGRLLVDANWLYSHAAASGYDAAFLEPLLCPGHDIDAANDVCQQIVSDYGLVEKRNDGA